MVWRLSRRDSPKVRDRSLEPESPRTWEETFLWFRSQPQNARLSIDSYFDDPVEGAAARFRESSEWRPARRLLPPARGRALDIGSGRGIVAWALAADGWAVDAVEPDPGAGPALYVRRSKARMTPAVRLRGLT